MMAKRADRLAMMEISVVFPQPDSPASSVSLSAGISRSTPRRAITRVFPSPNALTRLRQRTAAVPAGAATMISSGKRQPDRAVIVVTHDSRIFDFGDRIVHMSDGRIERVEISHRSPS